MKNICSFKGNKILIDAPGNPNSNRIKNKLIWDINGMLDSQYDLYTFYVCKSQPKSKYYFSFPGFVKRYVVFDKLDDMFIHETFYSSDEIENLRKMWDPTERMKDEIFTEACCMENVDLEYIAIENINQLLHNSPNFKTAASFVRWLISTAPIYVSLFGSMEMQIIINDNCLLDRIKKLVCIHCENRLS